MALNLWFVIWYSITNKIIGFFPNGGIPENVLNTFDNMAPWFQYANGYFPVDTLFEVLLVAVIIHGVLLSIKMTLWIYAMIRGSG